MQNTRWYQLSTLPMLVAMAVVAIFLKLNTSGSKGPEQFGRIISFINVGDLYDVEYSRGWPLNYATRRVWDPSESIRKMTEQERKWYMADSNLNYGKKNIDRWASEGPVIAGSYG